MAAGNKGKSSSRRILCDPCKFEGKTLDANTVCQQCREFYCEECKHLHKKFQVSRDHVLANIKILHDVVATNSPAIKHRELTYSTGNTSSKKNENNRVSSDSLVTNASNIKARNLTPAGSVRSQKTYSIRGTNEIANNDRMKPRDFTITQGSANSPQSSPKIIRKDVLKDNGTAQQNKASPKIIRNDVLKDNATSQQNKASPKINSKDVLKDNATAQQNKASPKVIRKDVLKDNATAQQNKASPKINNKDVLKDNTTAQQSKSSPKVIRKDVLKDSTTAQQANPNSRGKNVTSRKDSVPDLAEIKRGTANLHEKIHSLKHH